MKRNSPVHILFFAFVVGLFAFAEPAFAHIQPVPVQKTSIGLTGGGVALLQWDGEVSSPDSKPICLPDELDTAGTVLSYGSIDEKIRLRINLTVLRYSVQERVVNKGSPQGR